MPNWCECDLYIEGPKEKVEAFLAAVKTEESIFDFNRIVPQPPELSEVTSGSDEMGYRAKYGTDGDVAAMLSYPWVRSEGVTNREELIAFFERTKPEMMVLAERYKTNVEKYGATSWYEWCCEHWGTKWNAARASRAEDSLEWNEEGTTFCRAELNFETAWSPPPPVVLKASQLYPELEFDLRYFERGAAINGQYCCKGGEVVRDESGPYFGTRGG